MLHQNGGVILVTFLSLFFSRAFAGITFADSCQNAQAMLTDAVDMAKTAYDLLDGSVNREADPWKFYKVMSLYDSLFDAKREDSQARIDTVRTNLNAIVNAGSTQKNIVVICDDTSWWTEFDTYWQFHYPPTQTGYQYQKRDGAGPGPCSLLRRTADGEMVHPAGYTLTLTPEHSVIVQCRAFYQWEETRSQLTINEGDEFDTEFWSFNLGHELLHSLIDNMLSEGQEKYGFTDAYEIRSGDAPRNPDSVMMTAFALKDDKYLWNFGTAKTKKSIYDFFKENNDNVLKNFLLQDPGQ